jgi:hypothetical protein
MFEFWKQPKFWLITVLILWLAYVIGRNPMAPATLPEGQHGSNFVRDRRFIADAWGSVPLAQKPLLEERLSIDARTRGQQQHRRLIARLQHARRGRTDQERIGTRKRTEHA